MGLNALDMMTDYLRFKGITLVGVILYPIAAPLILTFLGFSYLKVKLEK